MPIPQLRLIRRQTEPRRKTNAPPARRKRSVLKRLLPVFVGVLFILGIVMVGAFAFFSRGLPDPNQLIDRSVAESTRIYARDGTTLLYEVHGEERRTVIELDDVPKTARDATIAIEDKDFYKHGGFKLTSIFRAVIMNVLRGGKVQGGSTITQQLVKNSILTSEKTYTRKIKELVLAYQIERRFTKDQILKLYFNQIPYGSNAYGIEAAAETYFGKPAKSLTIAEGALLAALPRAPTYYSPYGNHRQELLERFRLTIDRMAEQGFVTAEQALEAKAVDILATVRPRREAILAPHFVFYVRELLSDRYPEADIERGGLKIVTTLDIEKQRIAEEEVSKGVAANEKRYRATNAALVSLDVKSGQILAMVGSRDYFDEAHDGNVNVALAERNPGSSFKPFVYTTAFGRGFTPETTLFDLETNFGPDGSGKPYIPKDYDGKERGPVSMRQALAGSLNIPAVQTLYLAGIPRVVDFANAVGYATFKKPDEYGLALALGGAGVRLLEHTAAFGVLARDGQRLPTAAILRIEDARGRVIEETKTPTGDRVVEANVARLTNSILTDNGARAFIFGSKSPLTLPDRPVAAKTGTTNDWRDGWTVGFTPSVVTGVWAGNNDNSPMAKGADGVFVAAPIWHAYMARVLKSTPVERFPKPKPNTAKNPFLKGALPVEEEVAIDAVTRKRIPPSCRDAWPPTFVATTKLRRYHSVLFFVDLKNPNGDPPKDPSKEPMFNRWEKAIERWSAAKNSDAEPPLESCSLRAPDQLPSISFGSPADGATVAEGVVVTVTVGGPRPVSRVEYLLDDVLIATSTALPFGATLPLAGVAPGFHTLVARAVDDVQNVQSASLRINVVASASATLYFIEPTNGATYPPGDPITVRANASDPAGVSAVAVVERVDGNLLELGRIESPTNQTLSFSLPPLSNGVHQIALRMFGQNSQTSMSDFLSVSVGP